MKFVFDLDGTICFQDNKIDVPIIDALDKIRNQGHDIVFASARPIRDMLPTIPTKFHHVQMVGGNGGLTFENGQLNATYFEKDVVKALRSVISKYGLSYLADNAVDFTYVSDKTHPLYLNINKEKALNRPVEELKKISKFIFFEPPQEVKSLIEHLPITIFEHANEQLLDITPAAITKVRGLRKLGIDDFVAFGNDNNDVSMFQNATYSVCVGNHPAGEYATKRIRRQEVGDTIEFLGKKYL